MFVCVCVFVCVGVAVAVAVVCGVCGVCVVCVLCVVCVVQMIQSTPCLSRVVPTMHLIMGAVSLWTRPPALHLCAGP